MNRFSAALSTDPDVQTAARDCVREALDELEARPDLVFAFASPHYDGAELVAALRSECSDGRLLGCVGESIVGPAREVENAPALALWAASFEHGTVEPFMIEVDRVDDRVVLQGFPDLAREGSDAAASACIVLGDPFTFPAHAWLETMNETHAGLPILGGMASGASSAGGTQLFFDDQVYNSGAVGVVLHDVPVRFVVSQGCRPVGRPMIVTKSHRNVIDEIGGKPPLAQLQTFFDEAEDEERQLIQSAAQGAGLHVGQVVDECIHKPKRGDYLVRNVIGADNSKGSIAISDVAQVGKTVCFHVRDARSADEDLRELLVAERAADAGALLFTCNGRGSRMFDEDDHDAVCVAEELAQIPAAGFFAAGELGPVGGSNFLHGFTASLAVFQSEP